MEKRLGEGRDEGKMFSLLEGLMSDEVRKRMGIREQLKGSYIELF